MRRRRLRKKQRVDNEVNRFWNKEKLLSRRYYDGILEKFDESVSECSGSGGRSGQGCRD